MAVDLSKTRKLGFAATASASFFVLGLLISLMPSFYPSEAENKGVKPSQYGSVFGILSLAAFVSSPIFGKIGSSTGAKFLFIAGGFLQAISSTGFAFLVYIDNTQAFIFLSYFLRALLGISEAAIVISIFSMLTVMFPDKVARLTSMQRMFLGIGYMLGPIIGSLLFSLGGFLLPFLLTGMLGMVLTMIQYIFLPKRNGCEEFQDNPDPQSMEQPKKPDELMYCSLIKHPILMLPFLDNFVTFCGIGMFESMLEPYLKGSAVHATQFEVAVVFFIFGVVYTPVSLLSGYLTDKYDLATMISIVGNGSMAICNFFLGPAPFLTMGPSTKLIFGVTVFQGIGFGLIMGSTFAKAYKESLQFGFSDSMATYLFLSAMWSASFQVGNYVGPTAGGLMVQRWGFRDSTMAFCGLNLAMMTISSLELAYEFRTKLFKYEAM